MKKCVKGASDYVDITEGVAKIEDMYNYFIDIPDEQYDRLLEETNGSLQGLVNKVVWCHNILESRGW